MFFFFQPRFSWVSTAPWGEMAEKQSFGREAPPSTPMNGQEMPPVDLSAAMDPSKVRGVVALAAAMTII